MASPVANTMSKYKAFTTHSFKKLQIPPFPIKDKMKIKRGVIKAKAPKSHELKPFYP